MSRLILQDSLIGRTEGSQCCGYLHGICHFAIYVYKWRDIFLANIDQPFEAGNKSKKEDKLGQENNKLRKVIGDLTIELKKKKRLVKFQRKSSLRQENLDAPLVETIKELKSLHPFWGYRAIPVNIKNINSLLWTTSITGL